MDLRVENEQKCLSFGLIRFKNSCVLVNFSCIVLLADRLLMFLGNAIVSSSVHIVDFSLLLDLKFSVNQLVIKMWTNKIHPEREKTNMKILVEMVEKNNPTNRRHSLRK